MATNSGPKIARKTQKNAGLITILGNLSANFLFLIGDMTLFFVQVFGWMVRRPPSLRNFIPVCYVVGVRSVPVVAITGMFIGMVMAVQFFDQFQAIGLGSRIGAVINMSLVIELGPVLAATMLAGRVGSAMAAELATMRVTDQIDAMACLGTHPVAYLVVPRFLACVLLIPLLTVVANFAGTMGGAMICIYFFEIESYYYWEHTRNFIEMWDLFSGGFVKAIAFGAVISLISCHRGFHSHPGAEGVGRAATEAFVMSFLGILIVDFFLGLFLLGLYTLLFGEGVSRLV